MNFSDQFLASLVAARSSGITAIVCVATLVFISKREQGAHLSVVARAIGISAPNATGTANVLIQMGLAERKPSSNDRRVIRLAITDLGKEALEMILNPKPKTNV
jgi:DNA-binding MarR family transcriptional regulator